MPEAVVFILRAVVLVLLWGFVIATVMAVRHDVFGTKPKPATAGPAAASGRAAAPAARHKPSPARRLVVTDGAQRGTSATLTSAGLTIGRAADCGLVLTDDYASNHHARLTPRGDRWLLEDTGSTNGTYVGDVRVGSPTEVRPGAAIRIGRTAMELQA
jgi:hypothetical protein